MIPVKVVQFTRQHVDLRRVHHGNMGFGQWSGVGTQIQDIKSENTQKALDAADADVLKTRHQAAQPVAHKFELVAAP